MIGKLTRTIVRTFAFALTLCATTSAWAAAPTPVAEWNGDLENGSTRGKYTMSSDSSLVSFADGNATLAKSTAVASKGVQISWPDPASDAESFTSKKMSVVIQYSGLDIATGNSCLLGLPWNSKTSEYVIYSTGGNGRTCLATSVVNGGSGNQYAPTVAAKAAPTKGKLLVTFSGDSTFHPGVDLYFSAYSDGKYGAYERISYWNGYKVDNGTFYGLKICGTITGVGKYHRAGMTVEAVQIYDDVVSATAASMSSDMAWSDLVWDKDMLDLFPASLWTYIVNVTEDATLNLSDATIAAQSINFNIASGKTLTLEGTATITGASISVTGGGKLKLNTSNPGCAITVASGGTMDIAVATVSCAITNNGTINANGCAFNGAVTCNGTINTSGDVSFSSSVNNTFYYGSTLNVSSGTTTYNSSSDRQLKGNVTIQKYATLVNAKHDALNYDANSSAPVNVYIYGTLTMSDNWTIGKGYNTLHLYDGSLINGTVNNALHFNTGVGVVIAETGDSVITAPFVKGNGTISLETKAGATLSTVATPTITTRTGDGKLFKRIVNTRWDGSDAPSNYDGIELYSSGTRADASHSTTFVNNNFEGILKVTNDGTAFQGFALCDALSSPVFNNRPTLISAGGIGIYRSDSRYPFKVKNLSGSGYFCNYYGTTSTYKYIDTLQTEDTIYSGVFQEYTANTADSPALTVSGDSELHSLTLTGASDTTGPLVIENNAKVVFSSTGKWSGGTVTVKNGGVLESQNSTAVAANLKVEEGATLVFADGVQLAATEYDWSSVSNDGSVYVDLSAVTPSDTPVTLIASDVTVTKDKFYVTAAQRTATLSVEDGALKATFSNNWHDGVWGGTPVPDDNATLYISQNSTLTVSEALSLGTVTVVKEGDGNVVLTISGAGALTTGGWTIPAGVTVNTPTTMTISGDVSGDGVINVPANTTLAMDGVTCSTKVTVAGTLETSGATTLSAANTSASGSLIHVVGGKTVLSTAPKGIKGNITIDRTAELQSDSSHDGGYRYQHIDYNGSSCIDIAGTLNMDNCAWFLGVKNVIKLRNGANVTGWGRDTDANYGNWAWVGSGNIEAYGDSTLGITINTASGVSPVLTISPDATLKITKAFMAQNGQQYAGGSLTKAGAGTLDLTAITPTKPITINAGTVVASTNPANANFANMTINQNGTFKLKDVAWTGAPSRFSGSGTLELYSESASCNHTVTGVTFPGIVKLSNVNIHNVGSPNYQNNITPASADMFAANIRPEFILDSDLTHLGNGYYNNNPEHPLRIKNLSGSGEFRGQWGSGEYQYVVETLQERNTTYDGTLGCDASSSSPRCVSLSVIGSTQSEIHSLTITQPINGNEDIGCQTSTLKVSDYSKVIFSENGGWGYGHVIVGDDGYLECTNNAAVKKLTLNDGATLVFPTSSSCLSEITSITFSSGTVTVSYPSGVTPTSGTKLINWSSAPAGSFVFDDGADVKQFGELYYLLQKDEDGLYIRKAVAFTISIPFAMHYYPSVAVALQSDNTVDTVYLCDAPNETVTLAYGKMIVTQGKDVSNLTVNSASLEYASPIPIVNESYSLDNATLASVTYYWTGATDNSWNEIGNWQYGDAQAATRAVTSIDSVVFNDGASVSCSAASVSCAGMTINGNVTLAGANSKDINLGGNITGSGVLTLDNACLKNSRAEAITVANTVEVLFTKDSEIAASQSVGIRFNGPVSISDTIKTWDAVHTVAGTTTLSGNFNKSGGVFELTLGNVVVSASTTPTISAGTLAINGAITVSNGATFTIPASGLTVGNSASFAGSGTVSFTTIPSSALTFGENWTGTVALPEFNSGVAFNFNNYGKLNSTVEIAGFAGGWLQPPSGSGAVVINPNLKLTGAFNPAAYSAREYTFQAISGNGDFSVSSTDLTSMSIAKIASDYTGTITNTSSGKPITITVVDLAAVPAVGDRLLKVSGDNITISGVTVNGTPTPLKWKRKTVGGVDGFYVVSGTIFSVY